MFFSCGFGQKTYFKLQKGSKYSIEELSNAVENANWCGYFHLSANYEIHFDDGAVVKLKNKAQLNSKDNESIMNDHCFQNIYTKSEDVHIINSKGWITIPKDKITKQSKSN